MRTLLFSALVIIPFYWLCLCNHIFVVSGLCLDDQSSLLLQLKNNFTLSEGSNKLYSWNANDDCCSWMGVTCDNEGHVTALDLSRQLMDGTFYNSSALFSLQHLQKLNLADNNFYSEIPSGFNKLKNLTYLNFSQAEFRGKVPMEISQLTRLVTLDLSSYFNQGDLKLEIPSLHNLTSLRQLYLDGVDISAPGNEWCSVLLSMRDLQELSMSSCNLSGPLDPSLARLENLSVIVLDYNNLSSPVPETFAYLTNLTILSLSDCGLTGTFPHEVFNNEKLSVIDLSWNSNLSGFLPDFPPSASLQTLNLADTNFFGAFPNTIVEARNLSELDFSFCRFNGTLPNSLSNLTELRYVRLSSNHFTGQMPSFVKAKKLEELDLSDNDLSGSIPSASHFEGLNNLARINMSSNSIHGSIPSSLFTLPLLKYIYLSDNQFNQLDELVNVSASVLATLNLNRNNLSFPFPTLFFQLPKLSFLYLSSNKFNGSEQLIKFSELKNLIELDLSYTNLSVNVNVTNVNMSPVISFPNLKSCNLKTFPAFLRNWSSLFELDLSNNQIQGIVPNWIWKLDGLWSLNISHNLLTDLEGPLHNINSRLISLDLKHNKLQGPLPVFFERADYLDFSSNKFSSIIPRDIVTYNSGISVLSLSNNSFSGSIPESLCNASNLQLLDLSNNNISGTIPSCLMEMSKRLAILNLRKNNLSGPIPDTFSTSCALRTLDLQYNKLNGKMPKSLSNCTILEVLDLGNNEIKDVFPCLLKNISTLRVLVLRKNKFYGHIGCRKTNGTWHMLQIVDLAINRFSGKLPENYFTGWEAMIYDKSDANYLQFKPDEISNAYYHYQDSVTVTIKAKEMELVKILTIITSIDLSFNHLQGEIPKELFDLKALYTLNLSNNAFSGQIPSSIGNLKKLESLDLSRNSLTGNIPTELATLSFLSVLNLSSNHLVGKIPTGTQLQSFPNSSYEGNDGLYGPPLTAKLDRKEPKVLPQPECGRFSCTIDWSFISVELGLIFGHGLILGPLLVWKRWRVWYWQLTHKILCWIFPQMYVEYVTKRGQTYTTLRWQS